MEEGLVEGDAEILGVVLKEIGWVEGKSPQGQTLQDGDEMCAGTVDNPQCKVVHIGATFKDGSDFL